MLLLIDQGGRVRKACKKCHRVNVKIRKRCQICSQCKRAATLAKRDTDFHRQNAFFEKAMAVQEWLRASRLERQA